MGLALIHGKGIWYIPLDVMTAMTAKTVVAMAVIQAMGEDMGGNLDLGEKERRNIRPQEFKAESKGLHLPRTQIMEMQMQFNS